MPLAIVCGGCKRKLRIPEALVGKPVKCPGCARKLNTTPKPKAADNGAAKPTAAKASAQTSAKGSTKGVADPKKTAPASKTAALKKPAPAKKSPDPPPATKSSAKAAPPAKPKPEAPVKPAAKPMPAPRPPAPAPPPPAAKPKAVPARKSADDDEGSGAGKLVIFGGGFVGLFLVIFAIWWLFSGEAIGIVTGTVTLNNEPLEAAAVVFIGDDNPKLGPFRGITKADGKYQVIGPTGGAIPAGKYKVLIEKWVMPDGKLPKDEHTRGAAIDAGILKNLIAPDNTSRDLTTLRATVTTGTNRFDWPAKPAP